MKEEVKYNVWTIIEKVTITDNDEEYEDIPTTYVKVGMTDTLDEAIDIQNDLAKGFESTQQ